MQQQRIRSFILYTLAAVCVAGWGFFALRVLLPATLPFWLGLLIAAVLRPVTLLSALTICRRLGVMMAPLAMEVPRGVVADVERR